MGVRAIPFHLPVLLRVTLDWPCRSVWSPDYHPPTLGVQRCVGPHRAYRVYCMKVWFQPLRYRGLWGLGITRADSCCRGVHLLRLFMVGKRVHTVIVCFAGWWGFGPLDMGPGGAGRC